MGDHLEVVKKISNIGSVTAMCVVKPSDAAGQNCLVACCGIGSPGNLNIMHDGIDVTGTIVGIKPQKMRQLCILNSPHGYIIIMISARDVALAFLVANDGSTSAAKFDPVGFDATTSTLCCCNLGDGTSVQLLW